MSKAKIIILIVLLLLLIGGALGLYFYNKSHKKVDCGVSNCHGMDVSCDKPVQMCTADYQLGDRCREFITCESVNGQCQQKIDPKFEVCKSCITTCQKKYPHDVNQQFLCESACGEDQTQSQFALPIANFKEGQTKKVFGQYITPQNSPVQPEKFTGYHTGVDIEQAQDNTDVPVYSIADGEVRFVNSVDGYGGVIIIEYQINNETMTALYGHIRLSSASIKDGDQVKKGDQIAVLGTGYSSETDGERKHLHFGIHIGNSIDYRGYVQAQSELSGWIDPKNILN